MAEANVEESDQGPGNLSSDSEYPGLDVTYGLTIRHAEEDIKKLKDDPSSDSEGYLLENNLYMLNAEIESMKEEKESGFYGDFVSHPQPVGIENSLKSLYTEYVDEANKRGFTTLVSKVENRLKDDNKDAEESAQNAVYEESKEQEALSDDSEFPDLDTTYGYVIENATESMKKIKEGSADSLDLLENHLAWLKAEIESLENEKETWLYKNHPKIIGIENSLRSLYAQYLEENDKRDLSSNLSRLTIDA